MASVPIKQVRGVRATRGVEGGWRGLTESREVCAIFFLGFERGWEGHEMGGGNHTFKGWGGLWVRGKVAE